MRNILAFILFLFIIFPAKAAEYEIDRARSQVSFSGVHAGNKFQGVFEEWDASITFNPKELTGSKIFATFNPESAKTGNTLYDKTLPQADWFDTTNHRVASFKSKTITKNSDGSFKTSGDLNIRGITKPITFDFKLKNLNEDPIIATALFPIDRIAFDIGKKSDVNAEWVSKEIMINISITAATK